MSVKRAADQQVNRTSAVSPRLLPRSVSMKSVIFIANIDENESRWSVALSRVQNKRLKKTARVAFMKMYGEILFFFQRRGRRCAISNSVIPTPHAQLKSRIPNKNKWA